MKVSKRLLSFFTALLLVIAFSATVFASGGKPNDIVDKAAMPAPSGAKAEQYYIWVQVTDNTDTWTDSCNNSAGYLVIKCTNGATWHSYLSEGRLNQQNKTWTFAYGDSNNYSEASLSGASYHVQKENQAVGGFPTELKLVASNDPNSTTYVESKNKTYTSNLTFKILVTGDLNSAPIEVASWDESVSIVDRDFDDSKVVAGTKMPKLTTVGNIEGPATITLPDVGQSPVSVEYSIKCLDQYNAIIKGGNIGTYNFALRENISSTLTNLSDDYSTAKVRFTLGTDNLNNLNHMGDNKVWVYFSYEDGFTTVRPQLIWPKRQITYKNYDGEKIAGPFTVNYKEQVNPQTTVTPKKPADQNFHYIFDKYTANNLSSDGRVVEDTVFTAQFNEYIHEFEFSTADNCHVCKECGYKMSLADKLSGKGTESNPYQIGSLEDWNFVRTYISICGELPADTYLIMTADISGVDNYIGRFASATFDGRGHSITLNFEKDDIYAPFSYVENATIKNLKIAGSANGMIAAGIAIQANGNVTIENCNVSATLAGDSFATGFIGMVGGDSSITIKGSSFTGKLLAKGDSDAAGFAWSCDDESSSIEIIDCLYAPAEIGEYEKECNGTDTTTFYLGYGIITNSYYTRALGTEQGKAAREVTAGDKFTNVASVAPIGASTASYSVSGITAYNTGFTCGKEFFFGVDDQIALKLDHKDRDGYLFVGYNCEDGIIEDGDPYTLTVPDADVAIVTVWSQVVTVTDPIIEIAQDKYTYIGKEITPEVTVKDGDSVIPEDEYTVIYSNNKNAGTATITIKNAEGGLINVSGSRTFTIEPSVISIIWSDVLFNYDGKAHCSTAYAGGLINDDVCDITIIGSSVEAGDHVATATSLSNRNYKLPSANTVVFTITAPEPTISATPTVSPVPATPTVTTAPATPTATEAPATPTTEPTKDPTPTPDPAEISKSLVRKFVDRIYTYVLDREPEEEGARFWTEQLYSFKFTGAEVGLQFIFSDEFINRNTTNEEFVTILYNTFFGREPEAGGFTFWTSALNDGDLDRTAVANGFIYSQEWADTCARYGIRSGGEIKPTVEIEPSYSTYAFVERMYTTAMNRESDEEGKVFWAKELANFRFNGEQVGVMFFLSDEMKSFNLSNEEFVTRLYKTFMDRDPEEGGFNFWVGYLNDGNPRENVVLGFTRSDEFVNKCIEARILPY